MNRKRVRIIIHGAVQGVGFRPFVYRLATQLRLTGWVSNSSQGLVIEIEGSESRLNEFRARLRSEKPQLAYIQDTRQEALSPLDDHDFRIRESECDGVARVFILPDIATCPQCLKEIFDPNNRRFLYPFTNCTHCGPRFSIVRALPYDRLNTSMQGFGMCPACEREYTDPTDRRFHAQPIACHDCGPQLELLDSSGSSLGARQDALLRAASLIRTGQIVALKGIGGFQLLVDATNEGAVERLRTRKRREEKPLAVMFPDFASIQSCCDVLEPERELLESPQAPIVLLKKLSPQHQPACVIAASVAPRNPFLGAMLPYSPLHHLLLRELRVPVVATSGNISDEPICIDTQEALERLRWIADSFLVHNRPIVRHVDDSVVRVIAGREMVLRRARGYAPLPISLTTDFASDHSILAVGADLKNTVALNLGGQVFASQHIGDLHTVQGFDSFKQSAADLPRVYDALPAIVACDLHQDYLSTKFANEFTARHPTTRCLGVQHHYAHILSCMAENSLTAPCLGVSWDGAGFGTDGTIWGGEFLLIKDASFERVAHFRPFRLAGGDAASRQPCRSAFGLLFEIFGARTLEQRDLPFVQHLSQKQLQMLCQMLERRINSPLTSSAGRFFDGVASIVGLRQIASFEGQAAMELEFAAAAGIDGTYPFGLSKTKPAIFDWQPMILEVLSDLRLNQPVSVIAAKMHNTLAEVVVGVARQAGQTHVALSGGCFQNRYLTERAIHRLRQAGFSPHWHRSLPPNDGGIALGQIVAALRAADGQPRHDPPSDSVTRFSVANPARPNRASHSTNAKRKELHVSGYPR